MPELWKRAKEIGITGSSGKRKKDLIDALRGH
ncbi:Rho termination factor N-terminal domain-containing protein [Leifsonia flava]|nr:Rho termination factor N-terminal domain-containing protein [Leifsonia flava]